MQSLSVNLQAIDSRSYPIHIGTGLLKQSTLLLQILQSFKAGEQIAIISNQQIAQHYLSHLKTTLHDYKVIEIIIPEGEEHKNLSSMSLIYDALTDAHFNRSGTIMALGGGVIGDISGFVAATWMRGVNYIQLPTTLLAQVDSSVGGKTAVNIAQGKNMVGRFYHPRAVLADLHTLNTLPEREFKAGLAEVIKYGLIYDADFFLWLQQNLTAILTKNTEALTHAVLRSCEIKAEVVAHDEQEQGLRAILNLGHTFGHAIEAAMGYGNWLHGEAISAGMIYAAKLSHELGWIRQEDVKKIIAIFQHAGLPTSGPKNLCYTDYWQLMLKDKKSRDQGLPLVLLESIGKAVVSYDYTVQQVQKIIDNK